MRNFTPSYFEGFIVSSENSWKFINTLFVLNVCNLSEELSVVCYLHEELLVNGAMFHRLITVFKEIIPEKM